MSNKGKGDMGPHFSPFPIENEITCQTGQWNWKKNIQTSGFYFQFLLFPRHYCPSTLPICLPVFLENSWLSCKPMLMKSVDTLTPCTTQLTLHLLCYHYALYLFHCLHWDHWLKHNYLHYTVNSFRAERELTHSRILNTQHSAQDLAAHDTCFWVSVLKPSTWTFGTTNPYSHHSPFQVFANEC